MLFERLCASSFHIFIYVRVAEWSPIGKWLRTRLAIRFLSISTLMSIWFSHLGFWSENFFLIVQFPDHCPLVPFLL